MRATTSEIKENPNRFDIVSIRGVMIEPYIWDYTRFFEGERGGSG